MRCDGFIKIFIFSIDLDKVLGNGIFYGRDCHTSRWSLSGDYVC